MRHTRRFSVAALAATAAISLAAAAPAPAQNTQRGLVNVAVEDVIIQAPISLAANICDVNVAVLATVADDAAACEATAESTATAGPNSNGSTRQRGLVNVLVDDVLVQVPVSVAANVCDVNVAVLSRLNDDAEACSATADAIAQPGSGPGGGNGAGGANGVFVPVDIGLADTALDDDTTDDGGQGDIVSPGTLLDPLPTGLTLL